jgi:hypothetical protein
MDFVIPKDRLVSVGPRKALVHSSGNWSSGMVWDWFGAHAVGFIPGM